MKKLNEDVISSVWPYLVLTAASFLLLYQVIFSHSASFCTGFDNLQQAYPWLNKLCIALHEGYLPVWDANTLGGRNFAGEMQTGIFYPINIVWCFLFGSAKGISAYSLDLLICFHYLISAFGMYKVARIVQILPWAGIATALVFTYTSALAGRSGAQAGIFFGLCLLPWSIYFILCYYLKRRSKKYLITIGLILGLQIVAGHMQPFLHTLIIAGVFIAFFEFGRQKEWISVFKSVCLTFFVIISFAILISFPQLYYSFEYISRSYRAVGVVIDGIGEKVPYGIYANGWIITPENIANLFGKNYASPNDDNLIYMGILPLFLCVFWLVRHRRLSLHPDRLLLNRILTVLLLFGVLSSVGSLSFVHLFLYQIPVLNEVRQLGRYIIFVSFSASLFVGCALTHISELKERIAGKKNNWMIYVLVVLMFNLVYLMAFERKQFPLSVSLAFVLASVFFVFLLQAKTTKYLSLISVLFIFIDLLLNHVSYVPANTSLYPDRFYSRNKLITFLESTYGQYRVSFEFSHRDSTPFNLGDRYRIQTKYGYGATFEKSYFDFTNQLAGQNREIDDLLNIRYILSDKLLMDSGYILLDSIPGRYMYERPNWYPRVYWKRQLGEPGKQIEVENIAAIQEVAYSDLYQRFDIDCPIRDTLIFSENCYPGWHCYDNQREIGIFPAPIDRHRPLFRAIALEKGLHTIEFKYNRRFRWF